MSVTKKLIITHMMRSGSTYISDLLSCLPDFENYLHGHFFPEKYYNSKRRYTVCLIRRPVDWYFSQWNYGRERKSGDIYRSINSIYYRIRMYEKLKRYEIFDKNEAFYQLFTLYNKNKIYSNDNESFTNFVKLVSSSDFLKSIGIKKILSKYGQGVMFGYLCYACFKNKRPSIQNDVGTFFKKNTSVDELVFLENVDEVLDNILLSLNYTHEEIENAKIFNSNRNSTLKKYKISDYINSNLIKEINNKEHFINSLCDKAISSRLIF